MYLRGEKRTSLNQSFSSRFLILPIVFKLFRPWSFNGVVTADDDKRALIMRSVEINFTK